MFPELYELAEAKDVGLSPSDFDAALLVIGKRYFPAAADVSQLKQFCRGLHLRDLALAQACSRGISLAWERFYHLYQGKLYNAALTLARNEAIAQELAGSIMGEFVGPGKSKLETYSGRGSLEGWLKVVLARAYVDRYRSERKFVSLDSSLSAIGSALGVQFASEKQTIARFHSAIEIAFREQSAEQRFILAAYFFDGCTLAEIGLQLDTHESTVSRRINRALKELRKSINRSLREQGMSARQIQESMRLDVRDLPFEIRALLLPGTTP